MSKNQGNILLLLISSFALVAICISGYLYWQNQQLRKELTIEKSTSQNPPSVPRSEQKPDLEQNAAMTQGWKTIIFSKYNFTMKLPLECWHVSNDAMNGTLVSLEDETTLVADPRNLLTVYDGCVIGAPTPAITIDLTQDIANGITKYSSTSLEENKTIDTIISTFKFAN